MDYPGNLSTIAVKVERISGKCHFFLIKFHFQNRLLDNVLIILYNLDLHIGLDYILFPKPYIMKLHSVIH